jgi:hypothetical protein
MLYRVLKPFLNYNGAFLNVNDSVMCDKNQARILINNGMIGGIVETAEKKLPQRNRVVVETEVKKYPKRKYRKKTK